MSCAGIGKTTLANEICVRWARDGFLSEDFDAVVLLPMRCVQQRSLEKVMKEYVGEESYQQLRKSAGSRCLIILEGLDEMHQKDDKFFTRLIKGNVMWHATIMITSRPHACDKLNANRRVEVIGFGPDEIKEFIDGSFTPNDEQSGKLSKQLNDYPHLKNLCYFPLNLIMIVDIFQCSKDKKLPSKLTELYRLFIDNILQRESGRKDKKCVCSGASLTAANCEILMKILPGIPKNAIEMLFLLCKLSFHGFFDWHVDIQTENWLGDENKWKDPKIIFTVEDLKNCGIVVTEEFDGFGLLIATHIHETLMDTSTFNFSHLSIQEFLSALYIFLLPQEEQLRLMNKHLNDFPNVFMFLCGLTKLKCNEMYQIVYEKLMSHGQDVVYAARCISESTCTSQAPTPFTLDFSGNSLLPYDFFCAAHIISNYPVSQVNMRACHMGDTGVEVLAKHYNSIENAAGQLELVNLCLNNLTADGMIQVIEIVKLSKPKN